MKHILYLLTLVILSTLLNTVINGENIDDLLSINTLNRKVSFEPCIRQHIAKKLALVLKLLMTESYVVRLFFEMVKFFDDLHLHGEQIKLYKVNFDT